jgi:hypothetical protein
LLRYRARKLSATDSRHILGLDVIAFDSTLGTYPMASFRLRLLAGWGVALLFFVAAWMVAEDGASSPRAEDEKAPTVVPKAAEANYIRVTHDVAGNPQALETSIVHLVPANLDHPGLSVDLISAVHVGDKGYYQKLDKRFDDYDVVLYELVAKEGTVIPKGGGDPNRNPLSSIQNAMKDLLELEYQLSGIDYTKKNFVHADLTPAEFAQSMKDKGESFWTIFFRLMAAGMAREANNPGKGGDFDILLALFEKDRAIKLKRVMADQFADMDMITAAFNGPEGSTLITERNKAALAVLGKQIDAGRKKIAIFYGGGHMPDMESRAIADYHLKRASQEWLEAWNLRDKK